MIDKTCYAIALKNEGDKYVEETIVNDILFPTYEDAQKWFWAENDWIEEDGWDRSEYEIIKIETTITRLGNIPKLKD